MTKPSDNSESLSTRMIKGAGVMISGRMLIRLLGVLSVSVTARLLTPEDFGIMGASSIVLGYFMLLGSIGFDDAILRMEREDKQRIDTLFTLRLIMATIMCCGMALSAETIANLLHEPRIETVLYVMIGIIVCLAVHSPAIYILRRRLQFKREMTLKITDKIINICCVLGFIYFIDRSFMGMVYGQLAGAVAAIGTSQLFYVYFPRLTFKNLKDEVGFSFWMFVRNTANTGSVTVDEIASKRATSSADFGAYHAAHDLSRLFVSEFLTPVGEIFAANVMAEKTSGQRFQTVCKHFFAVVLLMGIPLATGLGLVAKEIVYILLGAQWTGVIIYIPYIAFAFLALTLSNLMYGIYILKERQKDSALIRLMRMITIAVGCFIALIYGDALCIAQTFMGISILFLFIEYLYIFDFLNIPKSNLFSMFIRPVLAAIVMAAVVFSLDFPGGQLWIIYALLKVMIGAGVYCSTVGILWILSGKPEGGERQMLLKASTQFPVINRLL